MLLFRLFVFVFRAEVELFRADNKRFAFRFKKVAFADKFGYKAGVGVMVNRVRVVVLFDNALIHNHNTVAHGKRFFLVVRYINEGKAKAALQILKFQLQIFAQLVVECAQRLIQ